jgi:hypothetical protein
VKIQEYECIGGFADGKKYDGHKNSEMVLFSIKGEEHETHRYIEHEGKWWYWPLFNRLVIMNYYDWTVNDD